MPWIGTALALVAVGSAIRRKGVVRGTVDTALNAIPVVGAAKATVEMIRGREFIPDRAAGRPGLAQDSRRPGGQSQAPQHPGGGSRNMAGRK